jgi:uncharacterized protein (TIGR03000 family)
MRATFLSFALASAMALAFGGTAMAQRHGHGGGHAGGGGVHIGGGHVGGVHIGGGHVGGVRVGISAGYGGWGYPNQYRYGSYYGSGLYFGTPYYYGSPGYSYSTPTYGVVPPVTYATPAEPQPVMVTVILPKADAEVFLNDTATTSTGTERAFQSPPVEAGKSYQYTVKARWMENGKMVEQNRAVLVKAGQEVTVDFRGPAREAVAPPAIK